MKYKVQLVKRAEKSLNKLDRNQREIIVGWIRKNLVNTSNPRINGKSLKGELKDYWSYRVGKYRILADIDDQSIKIIIFNIGHRKDIYDL